MKIVSVINYKGGVGKTTLTACLESYLWSIGHRVLLVDLDAQCNLTCLVLDELRWKGLYPNPGEIGTHQTLREWYRGMCGNGDEKNLRELILRQGHHYIIPSHLELLDVDMELAVHMSQFAPGKPPSKFVNVMGKLRDQLREVGEREKIDVILLDCPPNFNIVTQTAIIASDAILVPVRPNPVSVMGIDHLIRRSDALVDEYNASVRKVREAEGAEANLKEETPKIMGVVFMMRKIYDGRAIAVNAAIENEVEENLKDRGIPTLGNVRHREKPFAEYGPFEILDNPDVPDEVREEVLETCQNIGKSLGFSDPGLIQI